MNANSRSSFLQSIHYDLKSQATTKGMVKTCAFFAPTQQRACVVRPARALALAARTRWRRLAHDSLMIATESVG